MSSTSYPLDPLDGQLKFEWANQNESLENLFKIFQEPFQSPVPIPRELITPVKRNQETDKQIPQEQNKDYYNPQQPIYSPNSSLLHSQNKVQDTAHLVQLPLENVKEELHKPVANYTSPQLISDSNSNYLNYTQEFQQRNLTPPYNAAQLSSNSGSNYTPSQPPAHFNSQYVSSQQLNQLHNRFQNGASSQTSQVVNTPNNNFHSQPNPVSNQYPSGPIYTPTSGPTYSQTPNQYNAQQEYHSNPPSNHPSVNQAYRESPPISQQQYQQDSYQSTNAHNYTQQNVNKYQRPESDYRVQSNSQPPNDYDYNHPIHQSNAPLDYQSRNQSQHQQLQQSQPQHQQQPQQTHQKQPQTHQKPIHSQNRSPQQQQPQLQAQPINQSQQGQTNFNLSYMDSNNKDFSLPPVATENKNLSIVPATILNGNSDAQYCDITEYLNFPQIEAARKLHLPPSTLSKRWKEAAPNRKWPWRTVCKLDKEISTLLHNIPQDGVIPKQIEGKLAVLIQQRQEELKPIVIRL